MKKKNTRIEGKTVKVKRQDIRIPLDFYNRLKKIAVERFNAPIHHRSNEPAISKTLLKLAELGIEYLESGLTTDKKTEIITTEVFKRLENLEQNQSDNNNDSLIDELTDRIKTMEQKIADKNPDKITNKLLKRIDDLERRFNDINTDKSSEISNQKAKVVEQQEVDKTLTTKPQQEEKYLSPQLEDNNHDRYNDNIEDFYSG